MLHALSLAVLLFTLWLLLSGHYVPLLLGLGAASVLFVVALARRMDVIDHESVPIHLRLRAVAGYWLWLIKEIAKANLAVTRLVLARQPAISPTLFPTRPLQRTDLGRVIYANSITLTPGTVSVVVEGDTLLVHALTREGADDIETDEMNRRVATLEEA